MRKETNAVVACLVSLLHRSAPSVHSVGLLRRPAPSACSVGLPVGLLRRPTPSACSVGLLRQPARRPTPSVCPSAYSVGLLRGSISIGLQLQFAEWPHSRATGGIHRVPMFFLYIAEYSSAHSLFLFLGTQPFVFSRHTAFFFFSAHSRTTQSRYASSFSSATVSLLVPSSCSCCSFA